MPVKAASENPGAALAMLRQRDTKQCHNPECDEMFEGLVITGYCSDECRFRAGYLRRKERALAKARKLEAAKRARRRKLAAAR